MSKLPLFRTETIPMSIPKQKRARLIKMQQDKIKRHLRNFYLTWEPQTMKFVTPYDRDGNKCGMTKNFADTLKTIQLQWRIHCYILGREKNGKHRIECQTIDVKTPCTHDEISGAAADFHWQMIEDFRGTPRAHTFITAAWIANLQDDVTNETAYKIFKSVGAWDIPADWEDQQ